MAEICSQQHTNCCLLPEHLRFVADKTVGDWRRILSELGIDDHVIRTVDEDACNRNFMHDSREIAYQGYLKWKKINPLNASFCFLTVALSKSQRNDVKEELKNKYLFSVRKNVQKTNSYHAAPVNYFVGRKTEIKRIVEFTSFLTNKKLLLLYGLPGVGKSELLQHSLNVIKNVNPTLEIIKPLFPSGETQCGLEDMALSILEELQPEHCDINHRVATLYKLLVSTSKPTLLVLEVSGLSFKENNTFVFWCFLDNLLRHNNKHLKIIATASKSPDISQMQHIHADEIHLKGLEKDEVITLLRMMNPTLTTIYCEKIYQVCGSHPFILRKLGAHIKNFSSNAKELDELIESLQSKANLEVLQPLISKTILKRDMKIVFDELETSEKETLVQLCGFHEIIPTDALIYIFGDTCYHKCKHLCSSHCVIERSSSRLYFKMNMLTRSFICDYAKSDHNLNELLQTSKQSVLQYYLRLLRMLEKVFYFPNELKKLSHLHEMVQHYQNNCKICPTDHDCRCSISKILKYIFRKRKSMIMMSLYKGLLNDKLFFDTVETCSKTVHFLRNVVCYEDLLKLYDEIFLMLDKRGEKIQMAITMANLVFIKIYHRVSYEKDENIAYLTKSINFLEQHIHFVGIPELLVHCYCNRGYLRGFYSLQYVKGVADIAKARLILHTLPDNNRRTLIDLAVYGYMSAILYRNKQYVASIKEREHQVSGYQKYLGAHPYTAKALNYQGQALAKIGKYNSAVNCCLASYQMTYQLNGEGVETMRVLSTFGKVLLKGGKIERGIKKLEYALQVGENALGEHDVTAWCYDQLAEAKIEQGFEKEADNLKLKASRIRKKFALKSKVSNRKMYSLQLSRDELSRYNFVVSIEEDNDKYIHFVFLCMMIAVIWRLFEMYYDNCRCDRF